MDTTHDYTSVDTELNTIVDTIQFRERVVLKELYGLKDSTSPSSDDVLANILEKLTSELAKPLSMDFETFFETRC
ncbi:unnamed protein product [Dibothriocephalus latus]|uniref:Uncharacterized protein n=1 Tax=Dibothriocephalus latus TaxID=60516 RepID=A0A3P6UXC2_DIBLA|nr:unnamed protein product [Dibothriocephalus latus]